MTWLQPSQLAQLAADHRTTSAALLYPCSVLFTAAQPLDNTENAPRHFYDPMTSVCPEMAAQCRSNNAHRLLRPEPIEASPNDLGMNVSDGHGLLRR